MPIDENFINLIKQIQALEKGVLERSSKNLITDVASYWLNEPQTMVKENSKTEDKKQIEPLLETVTTDTDDTDNSTPEADALALFKEQMADFPKFFVVEETDTIKLIEKTAKEERLLATISSITPNTFTIETALERKYKLKLEVIPLIEAFAKTIA